MAETFSPGRRTDRAADRGGANDSAAPAIQRCESPRRAKGAVGGRRVPRPEVTETDWGLLVRGFSPRAAWTPRLTGRRVAGGLPKLRPKNSPKNLCNPRN